MNVTVCSKNEEELVLDVSGTINSANAKEFQRLVEEERDARSHGRLVLDVEKVEFISSAGLRVLLRLERAAPLRIINASAMLMEVFQDTGFTSILDIRKAIPEISLDGCELISQGRLPYDVYVDQAIPPQKDYGDRANLTYACQFKMREGNLDALARIADEPSITSIIQYEVRMPGREPFVFSDAVMGGFASMRELLDGFDALQKAYPEQIPAQLAKALRERVDA